VKISFSVCVYWSFLFFLSILLFPSFYCLVNLYLNSLVLGCFCLTTNFSTSCLEGVTIYLGLSFFMTIMVFFLWGVFFLFNTTVCFFAVGYLFVNFFGESFLSIGAVFFLIDWNGIIHCMSSSSRLSSEGQLSEEAPSDKSP